MVVLEAAILAAIAVPIGLVLGLVLGVVGVRVSATPGEPAPPLVLDWRAFFGAAVAGVAVALVASLLPAVRAGRLQPLAAIRGTADESAPSRLGRAVGTVGLFGGALALRGAPSAGGLALGLVALLAGTVLVAPAVLGVIAAPLEPIINRRPPGPIGVALLHLESDRTRAAHTMSLVAIVLAVILAGGAVATTAHSAVTHQVDRFFGADFGLDAASSFDPEFVDTVRHVDGVASASGIVTTATGAVRILDSSNETTSVQMIEPNTFFDITSFVWIHGDDRSARTALSQGGHILVPDLMARRLNKTVGDMLSLSTPTGDRSFAIAATISSPSTNGVVVISITDGIDAFGATRPTSVLVDVGPSADPEVVRSNIEHTLGATAVFLVVTASALKADVDAQISSTIAGFSALLVLAAAVGALALANTLAVSVLHRRREIGTLRAVGAHTRQVAMVSIAEAACLVALAFVIAVPLGYVISRPLVRVLSAALGEHSVSYVFPWTWLPILAAAAVLIAVVASFAPARRAARLTPVAALRFE